MGYSYRQPNNRICLDHHTIGQRAKKNSLADTGMFRYHPLPDSWDFAQFSLSGFFLGFTELPQAEKLSFFSLVFTMVFWVLLLISRTWPSGIYSSSTRFPALGLCLFRSRTIPPIHRGGLFMSWSVRGFAIFHVFFLSPLLFTWEDRSTGPENACSYLSVPTCKDRFNWILMYKRS